MTKRRAHSAETANKERCGAGSHITGRFKPMTAPTDSTLLNLRYSAWLHKLVPENRHIISFICNWTCAWNTRRRCSRYRRRFL